MTWLAIAAAFVGAAVLAAGLNWLASAAWRRSAERHWTERARLLYPARVSAVMQLFLLPANVVAGTRLVLPGIPLAAVGIAALLGALLGSYPMDRRLFPELNWRSWLALLAVNWLVMLLPWLAILLAIVFMPDEFGPAGWALAGGVLLLNLAFSAGLGFRVLCWLGVLEPAGERLAGIVREVATRMGVPVRAVWEFDSPVSNAMALPVTRELIFTRKLLALHPDAEVAAICAHELGHLGESRWVLAGRILTSLALLPLVFLNPVTRQAGLRGALTLAAVSIALWWLRLRLSRRMERRADGIAAGQAEEPALYARALERLYQANQMPAVLPRRSSRTHPDLYDRMTAAGVTPEFPRPAPPKRRAWTGWVLIVSFFGLLVWDAVRP